MNKSQSEKKVYAFHAVFRVDVNDVKPFQNPTRLPFDPFLDLQSMPRRFKNNKPIVDSNFAFIDTVSAIYYVGPGWLRAYQNDYVIDNNVESAVISRTHTAPYMKHLSETLLMCFVCLI